MPKRAVVHNGIVENYTQLKKNLEKGHKFVSETDTEVVAHLVEDLAKKMPLEKAILKAFNMIKGSNAFVFLTKDNELIAIKNGSPLVIGVGKDENLIASDANSLAPFTQKVVFLDDKRMIVVGKGSLKLVNTETGKEIKTDVSDLKTKNIQSKLGKYKHYMEKEIFEQPEIIRDTLGNVDAITHLASLVENAKGVFYVGCGTASYVALAQNYLSSKIANIHNNFVIGSEFKYLQTFINDKSLIIAISQSGETIDVIGPVKAAKVKKAKIACITNVYNSTLWRLSDFPLFINAGREKAVCSTKAFSSMIAHLLFLNYILAGKQSFAEKLLEKTADSVAKILEPASMTNIKKVAKRLGKSKDVYIIGRGVSYPAALESALKLKEVAYIHSEGFAGGELKHGVIALIEKGTPCIVLAPNDETYDEIISNAIEIKARGGYIIGISPKNNAAFDIHLSYEDVGDASIIPSVVISQLLAYLIAVDKNYNADMPRNLAKSVTVK